MDRERAEGTETMNRVASWIVTIAALAALLYFFPLFHVVPLAKAQQDKAAGTFDPKQFAEKFWSERLLKSLDQAVPADVLLPAIQNDPAAARKKFGRTLGMSESYCYFVSGTGRVVSVSDDEVALAVTGGVTNAEVVLQTGLLFGNALRDGTGLLNVSDFPNSQDFNGIAEALNHLVETRVLPRLRESAKTGAHIRFVGCVEISDESADLHPLHVIPIHFEQEETEGTEKTAR